MLQKYATEITILTITVFVYFHFLHPVIFAKFMNSILGKILAFAYILFYTMIDKIYGLLMALLVVTYYQMDSVRWIDEGFVDMSSQSQKKKEFKEKHCSAHGELVYKDLAVKRDMTDVVFPQIKFENERNICNVCDKNCEYKII